MGSCASVPAAASAAKAPEPQTKRASEHVPFPISQSETGFHTHWRCDEGLMWPQDVAYCSQCPRGHALTSCSSLPCCHVCGGDASVCMSCTEGCSYGVCAVCYKTLNFLHKEPRALAVPADCLEMHSSGVSPAFLHAFKSKWRQATRGWSTGQVCHQLLKPLTCRSRGSMCEDLVAAASGEVGQPTLVLSHCWGNLFDDTVDAALQAVEDAGLSKVSCNGGGGGGVCCCCGGGGDHHRHRRHQCHHHKLQLEQKMKMAACTMINKTHSQRFRIQLLSGSTSSRAVSTPHQSKAAQRLSLA